MKLFTKILLCTTVVMTVSLCTMGYIMISDNFENALEHETHRGLEEYQLLKFTLQSGILSAYENEALDNEIMEAIAAQTAQLAPSDSLIAVLDETGNTILSTLPIDYQFTDVNTENENGLVCSTEVKNGQYRQVITGRFTQNETTVYLVVSRNISTVVEEKQSQQYRFIVSLVIVLCASVFVMLAFSYVLTRPIKRLIHSTRLFAKGKYDERVKIKTSDEIGEITDSFNQMADTLEDTIRELKLNAQQKEDFVANFAHELKTPLTSVIGYADMIYQKDDITKDEMRYAAGYIINEGMRLEALSLKLMELIVLGKHDFTFLDMPTEGVFQDISDTLRPIMERSGVQLTAKAHPAYIRIEYDLFKTLLLNIIDNAIKAGSKSVFLTGERLGQKYRITIQDDGCGIPKEKLSRITEAFYMVDKSRSRSQHGAGLGLAIASRIADMHGVKLEYQSELGVGTIVSMILEIREEQL